MTIQIIEESCELGMLHALLRFDNGTESAEFPLLFPHPHDVKTEDDLEWYFEEYMKQPYTAESKVRSIVEHCVIEYGHILFRSVFAAPLAKQKFYDAISLEGFPNITLEIVSQPTSTEFQSILWETIRDPDQPGGPLVSSGLKIVRRSKKRSPVQARVNKHPALNLLIVTARPGGEHDVNYRTIQRPLIDLLRTTRSQSFNPVILRPGTYKALKNHLDEKGAGFYHIIHFDLHGEVLEYRELELKKIKGQTTFSGAYSFGNAPLSFRILWGRDDLEPFEGKRAFLFFEAENKDGSEPARAEDIAKILRDHQIPVCILNACQSAKQEGDTAETSLAKHLHENGVDVVLAMRYSVTVTAAALMMGRLYEAMFNNAPLDKAVSLARIRLFDQKERDVSLGKIELEDWALPIVFQNRTAQFSFRELTKAEKIVRLEQLERSATFPKLEFGFKGRDLDILKIEKILQPPCNHLLLRGMIGVGKSTLLRYLAAWWAVTQFREVEAVVYLDLTQPLSFPTILNSIASKAMTSAEYQDWIDLDGRLQPRALLDHMKSRSFGLIFDNIFEWQDEQTANWLAQLEGRTFAAYGSVNPEGFLSARTFRDRMHVLEGLDKDASYELASEIVRLKTPYRWEKLYQEHQYDLDNLMELMAGFPSVMEKVLPFLQTRTVPQLLEEFTSATLPIEF
jgi:hypothetical protein